MTRYYFQNHDAVSHAWLTTYKGGWDKTSQCVDKALETGKVDTTSSNSTSGIPATANYKSLIARFISPALSTSASIGTTYSQMLGISEYSSNTHLCPRTHAYVTVGDSDTVRGTIVNAWTDSNEAPVSGGGTLESPTCAAVSAQAGDHIVIEVGGQFNETGGTGLGYLHFGGTGSNDLAASGTYAYMNSYPSWVDMDASTSVPSVTTQDATSITATTATLNGTVVDAGSSSVTERGFCVGTSPSPRTTGTHIVSGTTGAYTYSATSLATGAPLYFCAYAINSFGTAYGSDKTFTPLASSPTTYYVAKTGSDANDGSVGSPWQTIQHAAELVYSGAIPDGSIIQVGPGDYTTDPAPTNVSSSYPYTAGDGSYLGTVCVHKQGLSTGIQFRGDYLMLDMPKIHGFAIGNGTGGTAACATDNITFNGFDVEPPHIGTTNTGISGVRVNGANTKVYNSKIHHCPVGGVRSSSSSTAALSPNLTVQGCTFEYNYYSAIDSIGPNLTALHNDISHGLDYKDSTTGLESFGGAGSTQVNNDMDGIRVNGTGNVVSYNTFHDFLWSENANINGVEPPHPDCIQFASQSQTADCLAEYNTVSNWDGTFFTLSSAAGNPVTLTARYNVSEGPLVPGIQPNGNSTVYAYSNTFIGTDSTYGRCFIEDLHDGYSPMVHAHDNIFLLTGGMTWSAGYPPFVKDSGTANWDVHNNICYPCTGSADATWSSDATNLWNTNPLLDSSYHLQTGSPAIGAGTGGIDIGAYTYTGAITYTLTYTAATGGTITGTNPQTVSSGSSGTAVTAVPNTGYHFVNWSDSVTTASRTETDVTGNVTVTANFEADTPIQAAFKALTPMTIPNDPDAEVGSTQWNALLTLLGLLVEAQS